MALSLLAVATAEAADRQFAVDAILPKPIFPLTFRAVLDQLFATGQPSAGQGQSASPLPAAHG